MCPSLRVATPIYKISIPPAVLEEEEMDLTLLNFDSFPFNEMPTTTVNDTNNTLDVDFERDVPFLIAAELDFFWRTSFVELMIELNKPFA